MAKVRLIIAARHVGGLPRDDVVNTIYLDTDPEPVSGEITTPDYGALAQDVAALWAGSRAWPDQVKDIYVKAYDMGQDEPREVKADRLVVPANRSSSGGPREVALCLSFYSQRNLPRNRGRLYLGPFTAGQVNTERPAADVIAAAMALGAGIANIGGTNVDWCVRSSVDNVYRKVTNYWVDNEWDHIRARGYKATSRSTATTSE